MTWKKYRRLLIVVSMPLLLASGIFFSTIVPAPTYATIVCTQWLSDSEKCRTTDGLGNRFDELIRRDYPAWFDVLAVPYKQNNFPFATVSASQRLVERARILEVTPYVGTEDGPGSPIDLLRSRVGQEVSIVLGVESNQSRDGYLNVIGCNELEFAPTALSYSAGLCGVPDGIARVRFSTTDNGLRQLEAAAKAEIAAGRSNLILHYALGVPAFLVLFLLLSGLVWLIRRAWLYVAAA